MGKTRVGRDNKRDAGHYRRERPSDTDLLPSKSLTLPSLGGDMVRATLHILRRYSIALIIFVTLNPPTQPLPPLLFLDRSPDIPYDTERREDNALINASRAAFHTISSL